jgi:hypothetical protein
MDGLKMGNNVEPLREREKTAELHTTRANVQQPTRVRVAGSVPVMSDGHRAGLADAAHRSGAAVKASTRIE